MESFYALLDICAGNSPVSGDFPAPVSGDVPAQRPVTRSFDVFFDLHMNERFSKHSGGWLPETPSRPLWSQSNEICPINKSLINILRPKQNGPHYSDDIFKGASLNENF